MENWITLRIHILVIIKVYLINWMSSFQILGGSFLHIWQWKTFLKQIIMNISAVSAFNNILIKKDWIPWLTSRSTERKARCLKESFFCSSRLEIWGKFQKFDLYIVTLNWLWKIMSTSYHVFCPMFRSSACCMKTYLLEN